MFARIAVDKLTARTLSRSLGGMRQLTAPFLTCQIACIGVFATFLCASSTRAQDNAAPEAPTAARAEPASKVAGADGGPALTVQPTKESGLPTPRAPSPTPSSSPEAAAPQKAPKTDAPKLPARVISPRVTKKPGPTKHSARSGRESESTETNQEADVGDAGVIKADAGGSTADAEKKTVGHIVRYRDEESPLTFHESFAGKDPRKRAKEATSALENALEHSDKSENDAAVTVRIEGEVAVVRIGKILVTTLHEADAQRDGLTLERYAERMEGNLRAFVEEQRQRKAIQLFVLHVFLSVFFGVLGFLTLRFLRTAFDRWDSSLDRRRGSLEAISILRVPVISGEALGGSLAFGLAVGRVTAYVSAVIATFGAILGQFDATRPLLSRLVSWSAGPVLRGVETVVSAVPGVILAAVLFVGVRAGLRVLNLLLDGVSSKQIVWKKLPPARVPVFRVVVSALTVVIAGPLLVSAAFGQFGTPLEWLALGVGGVLLLASVPALASFTIGVIVLWRDNVRPGDWVQVGVVSGEVTHLSLGELSLVPEGGGTIGIPMLYLLWHPLRRLREAPEVSFELTVRRDRPAKDLVQVVLAAIVEIEPDAKAECTEIRHREMTLRISAPSIRAGVRQQLLIAVSDAVDRRDLTLPPTPVADPEDET